jgi:hypothetical protein
MKKKNHFSLLLESKMELQREKETKGIGVGVEPPTLANWGGRKERVNLRQPQAPIG